MQATSALYNQILESNNHYFETTVVIGDNGRLIDNIGDIILFGGDSIIVARAAPDSGFTENVLFSVATSSIMFSDNPAVGKAISAEIDVKMINPVGDIPRMGVIIPYVRAVGDVPIYTTTIENDAINDSSASINADNYLVFGNDVSIQDDYIAFGVSSIDHLESEWIQQGTFFIDTREISHNDDGLDVLTIHGYDAMLKAEQNYDSTELDWPAVDTDIVAEIASKMEVSVDPRTWDIMTGGYTLPLPTNYSCREILGYIASMYIGNFIMSDVGELRLVSLLELPEETRYLVTAQGNPITFGGDRILV